MAQWTRIAQLPQTAQNRVISMYRDNKFDIDVRSYCSQWIESQQWNGYNEAHVHNASMLLNTLVTFLNDDAVELNAKPRYRSIANDLQVRFSNQPLDFVHLVNTCLEREKEIMNESEIRAESQIEIGRRIEDLYSRTNQNGRDLQTIEAKHQEYVNIHSEYKNLKENISRLEDQGVQSLSDQDQQNLRRLEELKSIGDTRLLTLSQDILQKRVMLAERLKSIHTTLDSLVMQVIDVELAEWKQKQKLANNGAKFDDFKKIDRFQDWCENLADIIVRIRRQIDSLDSLITELPIKLPDDIADLQPENKKNINNILSKLVKGAFIVEKQPRNQVLKKGSKFDVTVRWLVHSKLVVPFGTPKIKQTLISEEGARRLYEDDDEIDDGQHKEKETILTKELRMECPSLTFKDVKVKSIPPRVSKTTADVATVAEQKYGILFSFCLKLGEGLVLTVRTMTLPVVMTTHGNYEMSSTATYLWDNHFSRHGRIPFQVSSEVSWPEFKNMLTSVFHGMTGRHLTESNLQYLGQKIFGTSETGDFSNYMVTWNQFVKDDIPGNTLKFWEWFWSIARLVKNHLRGPWNDGLIEGFADKLKVSECLWSQPIGTFMLRFSDGKLGGITIASVIEDPENPGGKGVFNIAPYTSQHLKNRGLADRIKDLSDLVALYPNIPKNEAFEKYYSKDNESSEEQLRGYIPHSLVNVIPGSHKSVFAQRMHRFPQCPQSLPPLQSLQSIIPLQQNPQVYMGEASSQDQPMGDAMCIPSTVTQDSNSQIPRPILNLENSDFSEAFPMLTDKIADMDNEIFDSLDDLEYNLANDQLLPMDTQGVGDLWNRLV